MSTSQVMNGDPCNVAANPPITTKTTRCRSKTARILAGLSGTSSPVGTTEPPHPRGLLRVLDRVGEVNEAAVATLGVEATGLACLVEVVGHAVLPRLEGDVEVETAEPEQPADGVEAGVDVAAFPPRDRRLCRAGALGELLLGEPGATPGLLDEVTAHGPSIANL